MPKKIYTMSPAEVDILRGGLSDPDYITGYFFRQPSQDIGWQFDAKFTKDGAWQKDTVMTSQKRIVISGGAGSGKTLAIGMGAMSLGMVIPYFKFLNVAQKAWQANLMYTAILELAENTLMDEIIYERPRRPHPKIVLRYRIGKVVYQSSLEFMSADRDATGLLSWRGDWINVEEAGLFDNLDEIVGNVATRLTGSSPLGRPYIARMSLISNPWDVPYFWTLFDMAASDPESSLALTVSTLTNKNVTDDQIKEMLKVIPKEDHERFLLGTRPQGKGTYFNKKGIERCEDQFTGEVIQKAYADGKKGYVWERMPGVGVYHMETPAKRGGLYFVIGDPGSGSAPARNAPCIMVWDASEFPDKPVRLVAFWWGNGYGAISPFTDKLLYFMGQDEGLGYPALFAGIDSTGTQAGLAELLNLTYFNPEELGLLEEDRSIRGLDFSGRRKMQFLVTLRLMIEANMLKWPKELIGIRSQLANYDPEKDRGPLPKLPQDIVATMAMSAFVIRSYYGLALEDFQEKDAEDTIKRINEAHTRDTRSETRDKRSPEREVPYSAFG